MPRKHFLWIVFIISDFLMTICWAEGSAFWQQFKTWRPVAAVDSGVLWTSDTGSTAYFVPSTSSSETYQYFVNHTTQSSSITGIFLGAEWQMHPLWSLQAGLGYRQASPFNAAGTFTQGVDNASQNTYSYHYGVLMRQLLLEGKLLYSFRSRFHPYILAGLGSSFNKAYQYYTDNPPLLTFTRLYQNNNTSSFSYEAGIGLDYDVLQNLRLGIGYRFTNSGELKLGSASIDDTSVYGTLSQSNLYANELLVQITWIS